VKALMPFHFRIQCLTSGGKTYANGLHLERFDECMHFSMSVLPYVGNDAWVESKIFEIDAALRSGVVPPPTLNCEHCGYVNAMVGMADGAMPPKSPALDSSGGCWDRKSQLHRQW
jgi:hypothetical protein